MKSLRDEETMKGWRNKVWGVKECWSNEFWTDSQLVWNEDVRSSSNTPSRVKSKVNSSNEEEIQIRRRDETKMKKWNKDEETKLGVWTGVDQMSSELTLSHV